MSKRRKLWPPGLKKDGADYAGGQILDPDNGKTYSSKISLTDGGKKLNVRGASARRAARRR